jgi:hypothetical protein
MYEIKELDNIVSKIGKLNSSHHIEILRIIKSSSNCVNISENSNGCFLNMNELDHITVKKIETYIEFHENQEKELYEHLSLKNNIKENLI